MTATAPCVHDWGTEFAMQIWRCLQYNLEMLFRFLVLLQIVQMQAERWSVVAEVLP